MEPVPRPHRHAQNLLLLLQRQRRDLAYNVEAGLLQHHHHRVVLCRVFPAAASRPAPPRKSDDGMKKNFPSISSPAVKSDRQSRQCLVSTASAITMKHSHSFSIKSGATDDALGVRPIHPTGISALTSPTKTPAASASCARADHKTERGG
mmetsp:Transcript_27416/g.69146  ORF Transcript_27416/g.69146 Transcript_27416/m.69146 type:complete len:150 (-) Transcript_27416:461-910(-)